MSSVYPPSSNKIVNVHRLYNRSRGSYSKYIGQVKRGRPKWRKIQFSRQIRLIKDPNSALRSFNTAYSFYHRGFNVEYDLSDVQVFSPESIAVLAASIASTDFTNNRNSTGNLPQNFIVANAFRQSGFFDHVNSTNLKPASNTTAGVLLHKVTDYKVETQIARSTCEFVMRKSGIRYVDDMEPLYVTLIEAMQNTNNHASNSILKKYDWWLYRSEDKYRGLLHFTFLDIGVGVFNSLTVMNLKEKLLKAAKLTANVDLVEDLFAGRIKSSTGRMDRGKGIPQIHNSAKEEIFEEFFILTNDVLVDLKTDKKTQLTEEFHGTLYYWTIRIQNN